MPSFSELAHQIADAGWDYTQALAAQEQCGEEEYLAVTDWSNWMIEYTDGRIDILPRPTIAHQFIVKSLLLSFDEFLSTHQLGVALQAPLRVLTKDRTYRLPDIVFKFTENLRKSGDRYFEGADLVIEIVSDDPKGHRRDYIQKRIDYSEAGISEYWIVDPQQRLITVLALDGKEYAVHGEFRDGEQATSRLLDGFQVDVTAVFAEGER